MILTELFCSCWFGGDVYFKSLRGGLNLTQLMSHEARDLISNKTYWYFTLIIEVPVM